MKILRPGKDYLLEHECTGFGNAPYKGCGALLGINREDLRFYEGQEFPWRTSEPAVCFKCPCCGQVTDLGLNDWPRNYTNLIPWSSEWANA